MDNYNYYLVCKINNDDTINNIITSKLPFSIVNNFDTSIFMLNHDFDFSINIKNKNCYFKIIKLNKSYSKKDLFINGITLFNFKLDYNYIYNNYLNSSYSVHHLKKWCIFNSITIRYKYSEFIYNLFKQLFPNELISIIVSYLNTYIEYSFNCSKINNNFILSKPNLLIPKIYY